MLIVSSLHAELVNEEADWTWNCHAERLHLFSALLIHVTTHNYVKSFSYSFFPLKRATTDVDDKI